MRHAILTTRAIFQNLNNGRIVNELQYKIMVNSSRLRFEVNLDVTKHITLLFDGLNIVVPENIKGVTNGLRVVSKHFKAISEVF